MQFYESEIKLLKVLWEYGQISSSDLCSIMEREEGWKRTTTYTMVEKCVKKGYVEKKSKIGKGFICKPKITKEEAQIGSVSTQIEKSFHSKMDFLRTYLNKETLTDDEIEELHKIVDELGK